MLLATYTSDLDSVNVGVYTYDTNTTSHYGEAGICICVGIHKGIWAQLAFPTGGGPAWRRYVNGVWSSWWKIAST